MAPWIKKTEEEYKRFLRKRKLSLSIPIWFFPFCFVGTAIFRLLGSEWERPISVAELAEELPYLFSSTLCLAAIVYIIQILWRSFRHYPLTLICDKCKTVRVRSNLPNYPHLKCTCGGTYVDADSMKWVKD
jgi:hypothetical protein